MFLLFLDFYFNVFKAISMLFIIPEKFSFQVDFFVSIIVVDFNMRSMRINFIRISNRSVWVRSIAISNFSFSVINPFFIRFP